HSIDSNDGRGGGGFVVLGGRSFRESKNACGEVEGVEKMSSKGPSLWLEVRSVWKVVSVPIEVRINKEGDDFRQAFPAETYLASVVEIARAVCFLENHDVRQHLINVHIPLVLLRST
ncbi:hypothetical protein Tco_0782267, partial [Tanacetum coccineum]